jgi:hypothetical protein
MIPDTLEVGGWEVADDGHEGQCEAWWCRIKKK